MLEIFNHNFCCVASTVFSKVFEFLHKAGGSPVHCMEKSDRTSPNTPTGPQCPDPQPCMSLNHGHQHGFDRRQLLQRKSLHAQEPLPTGSVGEATLLRGCKRV